MRTPLIAGNWKMHKTLAEARALVRGIRQQASAVSGVEILICPPFPWLLPMAKELDGSAIMLGAQNAHQEQGGAFTGEVSVPMLRDAGCTHVILGHSERRQYFKEDGSLLAAKVRAAVAGGLRAVFCVGETLAEREAGRMEPVVGQQIDDVIGADVPAGHLIVAYEPVWAIGTGKTATPQQAQDAQAFVRGKLASVYGADTGETVRILYGGSVKPSNAAELLAQPDIDGALVGGACLVAEDFMAIVKSAAPAGVSP
ncbi:MAG: triose-phosphate isomerase [Phycisphaerae bacterium]|jgi:triosephosphate isomerase